MVKCRKLYNLSSEHQIAQSATGKWFQRRFVRNAYSKCRAWEKWQPLGTLESAKRIVETFENLNGNEVSDTYICLKFVVRTELHIKPEQRVLEKVTKHLPE